MRIHFFPADADEAEQERKQADQGQNGRGGQKRSDKIKHFLFAAKKIENHSDHCNKAYGE